MSLPPAVAVGCPIPCRDRPCHAGFSPGDGDQLHGTVRRSSDSDTRRTLSAFSGRCPRRRVRELFWFVDRTPVELRAAIACNQSKRGAVP